MLQLISAGATKEGRAFDVRTRNGAYAGLISEHYGKSVRVYFDSNANRGSARKFASVSDAVDYLLSRRVKKGYSI